MLTLKSFFENPSFWGLFLAFIFGAFWLALLLPVGLRRIWLWVTFLAGALLFIVSILWVQVPLQRLSESLLSPLLGDSYGKYPLLVGIPPALISGFVQEAAKFIPAFAYFRLSKKNVTPLEGFSVGAMSGAGFGVFEAQWVINTIFAYGFKWNLVLLYGFEAITGIWERFVTVIFHASTGALMGFGLARKKAWQFFLFASLWHGLLNYIGILFRAQKVSVVQVEIIISILIIVPFGLAFFIRREKGLMEGGLQDKSSPAANSESN